MEGVTQELADTTTQISYRDLPDAVVHKIKQVLLDSIGCGLAGYVTDRARIALELVDELGGKPQAAIIGGGRTSWSLAAYANGELINALDFDALGPLTGHVTPFAIPPCLTLGERASASGQELITAMALGLEIGGRVASSMPGLWLSKEAPPYFEENPRFSYTFTIFGAVAAAGKLLGLNAGKMANAFGIAGASTPVPGGQKWEHISGPAIMMKYNCNTGWIAQLATTAALLAERGFTGDTTFLDSDRGFWKIVGAPYFKPEKVVGELGKVWHIEDMTIKAYPCCGANHTSIEAINKIMAENAIAPDDIEAIVVNGEPLLLTPNRAATEIAGFSDTQFCNRYIFALAPYLDLKPGPAWQMPVTYNDPKIAALMKRVTVKAHPKAGELTTAQIKAGLWAMFRDSIVEIRAKGKKYAAEVTAVRGSSKNPLSDDEVKAKFRNNAGYSPLKTDKAERLVETVYRLEEVDDIADLMRLVTTE